MLIFPVGVGLHIVDVLRESDRQIESLDTVDCRTRASAPVREGDAWERTWLRVLFAAYWLEPAPLPSFASPDRKETVSQRDATDLCVWILLARMQHAFPFLFLKKGQVTEQNLSICLECARANWTWLLSGLKTAGHKWD